jgi:hypothetical protein
MIEFGWQGKFPALLVAMLLCSMVAGCGGGGGGRSEILGSGSVAAFPPTVTAVVPINNSTGVAINTIITAAFSEPMAPITGAATFTVTCAAPCVNATGTVALDATNTIATFTLTPGTTLAAGTLYTATVTGAASLASGLALAAPYTWQFTTGVAPNTTRPIVILTVPATTVPGPTSGVPTNTAITAVFSEDMNPLTITGSSFTVTCAAPCVSPAGTVSYAVGSRTAVFAPAAALVAGTTYTATITTAATDLAGNALAGNQAALPAASNYVWTFTTAAAPIPPAPISVLSTNPLNHQTVCPNAAINATFNVPSGLRLNPLTVNSATFTVTTPSGPLPATSVSVDAATGTIATFTPEFPLTGGVTYTATITGGASGVTDLAIPGNTMAGNFTWNFTASSCIPVVKLGPPPIALGSAKVFGSFGGSAGITNTGILTVIHGSIGTTAVSTAVTGLIDSSLCQYTITGANDGTVNGTIYTNAPPPTASPAACSNPLTGEGTTGFPTSTFAIATQGRADALTAYNQMAALPPGTGAFFNPGAGNLANLVLPPGVYTFPSTADITLGNLTLDAQGDVNAYWVFQVGTALNVGTPGFPQSVIMVNGGLPQNVFWQVFSTATINPGGGGTMVGTVISNAGVVVSTMGSGIVTTVNGRLLSLTAGVTLVNTVINVPPE